MLWLPKNINANKTAMGIPAKELAKGKVNSQKSFTAYGTPTQIDLKKTTKKIKTEEYSLKKIKIILNKIINNEILFRL